MQITEFFSSKEVINIPFNPLMLNLFFDELDLTHIQQYLDVTVKISFQNRPPLRINEGRHSFAGFENISKRDQETVIF